MSALLNLSRKMALPVVIASLLGLVACGEVDQTVKSQKVYAGKKDARAYEGEKFAGDAKKWEAALAERTKSQNEYLRTDQKK
jgi:major membrane immunogen (membrane-anchored lipoprotein)